MQAATNVLMAFGIKGHGGAGGGARSDKGVPSPTTDSGQVGGLGGGDKEHAATAEGV